MSSKRIFKSVVDLSKMAPYVPEKSLAGFTAIRQQCDKYLRNVSELPADLPKINWDNYKGITTPGLVTKFKAEYEAIKVDYPKDKYSDEIKEFDKLETKVFDKRLEVFAVEVAAEKEKLAELKQIPLATELTQQEYFQYYPEESFLNATPTYYPHLCETEDGQMVDTTPEEVDELLKKRLS